jgi:hypothetical protein
MVFLPAQLLPDRNIAVGNRVNAENRRMAPQVDSTAMADAGGAANTCAVCDHVYMSWIALVPCLAPCGALR